MSFIKRILRFLNPGYGKDYPPMQSRDDDPSMYTEDGYHLYYDRKFLHYREKLIKEKQINGN